MSLPSPAPTASASGAPRPAVALAAAVVGPLAVVYVSLFVSGAILRPLSDNGTPAYVLLQFVVSAALCLGGLAVWPGRARAYALVAGGALTAGALLNLVHVFEYSQLVTVGAIDAVWSTSPREAGEFLVGRPRTTLLASALSVVAIVGVVWAGLRVPRGVGISRRVRVGAAALGVAGIVALAAYPMRLFPVSTVKNLVDYVGYRARFQEALAERAGASFGAVGREWKRAPVVVVVVGESTRRAQLGLYGYGRPTTPWLSAQADDVVVFSDAVTGAPVTQTAVALMMTAARPATVTDHAQPSWLVLAREAGFDTVWLSNQDRTDGTATALIADDAERVVYTSHDWSASGQYDHDLLPELDRALAERDGPLVVVMHLMGSHDDYALRYPDAFAVFDEASERPAAHDRLARRERQLVDHYDNSVRYTDWMLGQIFGRVQATGAPAVGLFVSDHGENLYDTPARMRGHGVPGTTVFEAEVPLVMWSSPTFRQLRPDVVAAARRNRDRPVSTADLFYTFADLVGAEWPGAEPDRSVVRLAFRPRTRYVVTPDAEVVAAESLGEGVAQR